MLFVCIVQVFFPLPGGWVGCDDNNNKRERQGNGREKEKKKIGEKKIKKSESLKLLKWKRYIFIMVFPRRWFSWPNKNKKNMMTRWHFKCAVKWEHSTQTTTTIIIIIASDQTSWMRQRRRRQSYFIGHRFFFVCFEKKNWSWNGPNI